MMEGEQTSLREHTRDAFKNETKHRKHRTRTRGTPPPLVLERSTSPMRIERGRSVKGRGEELVKFHRK